MPQAHPNSTSNSQPSSAADHLTSSDAAVALFADRWSAEPIAPAGPAPVMAFGRLLNDRAFMIGALLVLLIALASAFGGDVSSTGDDAAAIGKPTNAVVEAPASDPPVTPVQDLWGIYYP